MRPDNTKYRNYILDMEGIMAIVIAFLVAASFLGVFYAFYLNTFSSDLRHSMFFTMVSYILTFLPSIWAFDFFVMRKKGKKLSFNMDTKNFSTYLLIFPLMFGMMLIAEYITMKIPISGPFFGELYRLFSEQINLISNDTWGMIITTSLFAPVLEEILFRGILQKGMINKGVEPAKAIIITAVIFGLIHMNPWQFVGGVLLGMVLGLVYFKTKSLLMAILLHAFNNFISSILILKFSTESFADAFGMQDWMILVIGIVLFSLFYYLFMHRFKIHHQDHP